MGAWILQDLAWIQVMNANLTDAISNAVHAGCIAPPI